MVKKGWTGSKNCEFCGAEDSIDHLLFTCSFARFLWNVICGALGNPQTPSSNFNLCQNWLLDYTGKGRAIVSVDFAALLWIIWKTKKQCCSQRILRAEPTNVIFVVCTLLDTWIVLHKKGTQSMLSEVTRRLIGGADIFKRTRGWGPTARRLCQ